MLLRYWILTNKDKHTFFVGVSEWVSCVISINRPRSDFIRWKTEFLSTNKVIWSLSMVSDL